VSRLLEIDHPRRRCLPLNAPRDAQVRAALGLLGALLYDGGEPAAEALCEARAPRPRCPAPPLAYCGV
jgi:hypothetical protein